MAKDDFEFFWRWKGNNDLKLKDDCRLSWNNAILNARMFGATKTETLAEAKRRVMEIIKLRSAGEGREGDLNV